MGNFAILRRGNEADARVSNSADWPSLTVFGAAATAAELHANVASFSVNPVPGTTFQVVELVENDDGTVTLVPQDPLGEG